MTDLNNDQHMLSASVVHYRELNGDDNIKCQIYPQKHYDISNISDMMTLEHNDIVYKIVYVKEKTIGDSAYLDVRGIPLFYDEFRSTRIYPTHNGSMTAVDCFTQLFADSGYDFVLVDPAYASTWQNFGAGKSRMELFKSALEHYEYEFYVQGSTVYLQSLIGNDTNYLYKYRLNASNVSRTTDATAFATYVKGYGGFAEGETDFENNAELKMDYTHPLADIPGIGIRHAEPVTDGRITNPDTMQAYMERALEETLMITVEANLHDVRQMGYTSAVPQIGDRTFLMDERINLDTEIRVHSVETVTDAQGKLIDCKVEFGSQSIRKRYKSNLKTLSRNMEDLLNGKLQLPYDILAPAAKDMLDKIKSVDSELLLDNGIFAIDTANPNNIVGLNSAGIFISTDGGATAETVLTAEGMVANSIKTGDLMTHLVRVVGTEGLFYIDGDVAKWIDANNPDKYFEISPQGAHAHKGMFKLTRPDYYVDTNGKEYGLLINDGTPQWSFSGQMVGPNLMASGVSVSGQFYSTFNTDDSAMETWYFIHNTRYVNLRGYAHMYYPDGQDASGVVKIKGFGNLTNDQGQPLEAQQLIPIGPVGTDSQTEQVFINITLDLGVPDNSLKSFYIQGRSGNASSALRFRRLILNWYG